jgi:hypothetical protein
MAIRVRHLADGSVQSSDASTYTLNLPETGFLHALLVTVSATNGATSGRAVSPLDIADNVRVMVNGDERAFDLTPAEIEKCHESWAGYGLTMKQDESAAAVQSVVLPVLFGRWIEDMEYFLPCSRVKAPKLEVVYSPTIAADGGFATGTTTIDVVALWSPESDRLAYRGTLVNRTVKAFTSLASGDENTDIDTNELIRAISIYAYEAAVEDGTDVTAVILRANSGEFDLFNGDWQTLLDTTRHRHWCEILHSFKTFLQNNDTLATRLGHIISITWNVLTTDLLASNIVYHQHPDAIAGDTITVDATTIDISAGAEDLLADAADRAALVEVRGYSPSYFGMIEFTSPDSESGWLNPAEYSALDLIVTQGGAGAAVRISTQTVHKY